MTWARPVVGAAWPDLLVAAAAAAAITSFYFLKTRRAPVSVPSTLLWSRAVADRRANALWQRLRRSLLLALQLATVAAAAVALARPSWLGGPLSGGRYVFLIDNSASMSATDVAPSRLEQAKRRVLELIDQMESGDTAMVVSFADAAHVRQTKTDHRELLRRAVRSIEPTDRRTNIEEALRLIDVEPVGASDREAGGGDVGPQVFIATDGRFSSPAEADGRRFPITPLLVGETDAPNAAILNFAVVRRSTAPGLQALIKVASFDTAERRPTVELHRDGRLVDVQRVELAAGESRDLVFDVAAEENGLWEARLVAGAEDAPDCLSADDRAWTVLRPPQPVRVAVVTAGNRYLQAALSTDEARRWARVEYHEPSFLATPAYERLVEEGNLDLYLFDRCSPPVAPRATAVYFSSLPPGERWQFGDEVDLPQVIDVESTHPLLESVRFTDVVVAAARPLRPPAGGRVLVDSDRGPLAAIAPRGVFDDVVFGFGVAADEASPATNWPLVDGGGFEQFILNAVQSSRRSGGGSVGQAERAGAVLRFRSAGAAAELQVVAPDGNAKTIRRDAAGEFSYYATERVGPYLATLQGGVNEIFAVNLFDAGESNLSGERAAMLQGCRENPAENDAGEPSRLDVGRPFLLLMLALLMVEWYIYGSRAKA